MIHPVLAKALSEQAIFLGKYLGINGNQIQVVDAVFVQERTVKRTTGEFVVVIYQQSVLTQDSKWGRLYSVITYPVYGEHYAIVSNDFVPVTDDTGCPFHFSVDQILNRDREIFALINVESLINWVERRHSLIPANKLEEVQQVNGIPLHVLLSLYYQVHPTFRDIFIEAIDELNRRITPEKTEGQIIPNISRDWGGIGESE